MPKPDPELLNPERYPVRSEIGLRYSDLDVNRHVNNVAIVEILQEARGHCHKRSEIRDHVEGLSLMAASLSVQFLGEARHGSPIICYSAIISLGRTSQTIAQLATQEGNLVAYAETVMVSMLDGKPQPHSDRFRADAVNLMMRP